MKILESNYWSALFRSVLDPRWQVALPRLHTVRVGDGLRSVLDPRGQVSADETPAIAAIADLRCMTSGRQNPRLRSRSIAASCPPASTR